MGYLTRFPESPLGGGLRASLSTPLRRFFDQRRRWVASTQANLYTLLQVRPPSLQPPGARAQSPFGRTSSARKSEADIQFALSAECTNGNCQGTCFSHATRQAWLRPRTKTLCDLHREKITKCTRGQVGWRTASKYRNINLPFLVSVALNFASSLLSPATVVLLSDMASTIPPQPNRLWLD